MNGVLVGKNIDVFAVAVKFYVKVFFFDFLLKREYDLSCNFANIENGRFKFSVAGLDS